MFPFFYAFAKSVYIIIILRQGIFFKGQIPSIVQKMKIYTGFSLKFFKSDEDTGITEEELAEIQDEPNVLMTQEIWEHCVGVCLEDGDILQLRKLLADYPEYIQEWKKRYEAEYNDPNYRNH